jgi:anti-anti-sigma regulatory factor
LAIAAAVPRQVFGAITIQLTEVALDLITLTYIDSAGLRVLFTLGTRLETLQIALQLLVPTASTIRK